MTERDKLRAHLAATVLPVYFQIFGTRYFPNDIPKRAVKLADRILAEVELTTEAKKEGE